MREPKLSASPPAFSRARVDPAAQGRYPAQAWSASPDQLTARAQLC
jgi:hypothetical protein